MTLDGSSEERSRDGLRKRRGKEKKPQLWEADCAKVSEEKVLRLGHEPGREARPHKMVSRGIPGCLAMLGLPRPKQVCRKRASGSFK